MSDYEDCAFYISLDKQNIQLDEEILKKLLSTAGEMDYAGSKNSVFYNAMEKLDPDTHFEFDIPSEKIIENLKLFKHHSIDILNWNDDELLREMAESINDLSIGQEELTVDSVCWLIGPHEILDLDSKRIIKSQLSLSFHCNAPSQQSFERLLNALASDENFQNSSGMIEQILGSSCIQFFGAC